MSRDEAARREAGETPFQPNTECKTRDACRKAAFCMDAWHCAAKPDAPPPPADDLVARLRQYRGKSWEVTECYNGLRDEAAAAIEALRARVATLEQDALVIMTGREDLRAERDAAVKQHATLQSAVAKAVNYRADYQKPLLVRLEQLADGYDAYKEQSDTNKAREKALEGVLDKYRAGIVTHVQMTGPVFGGTNSRQLKIAFEADQALAAGGGNG